MKIQNNTTLTQEQRDKQMELAKATWDKNLSKVPWLERPTTGDASETALIKFLQPIEDILEIRKRYKVVKDNEGKLARMPFNSTNKYAFNIVEYPIPGS
jgi:sodium/potassium-transporting ATPase subunit alpha